MRTADTPRPQRQTRMKSLRMRFGSDSATIRPFPYGKPIAATRTFSIADIFDASKIREPGGSRIFRSKGRIGGWTSSRKTLRGSEAGHLRPEGVSIGVVRYAEVSSRLSESAR